MKIHEGIFAALYCRNKRLGEPDPWPVCIGLTVLLTIFVESLKLLISYNIGATVNIRVDNNKTYLIFIIIFGFLYFYFVRNERYKLIAQEYEKLSIARKKFWKVLSFTFIIFSISFSIATISWVFWF